MKIIVYTQRVEVIESYQERRDCADQRIAEFIYQCGYVPIPVPNIDVIVEKIIQSVKPMGIILTGGNSLCAYGGNAAERDKVDNMLIKYAVNNNIPLYGFCRGMQSILHYFGNELTNVKNHVAVRHTIDGKIGKHNVNSYHNQACIEIKENNELEIIARADDGVIEAIKHKTLPIMGTMWHPEREEIYSESDIQRIRNLFENI